MNLRKYFVFFCCTTFLIDCSQVASGSSEDEASIAESSSSGREPISSSAKSNYNTSSSTDVQDEKCTGDSGTPWDGTTAKDFACGAGTKLSPYIILTAEQLAKLSFIVGSNDKEYQGKYYKLGADIILNDGKIIDEKGALAADSTKLHKWTPIGNSSVAFTGTFDGDGHTVSGMFINTTSSHNGLFGNSSGTVENLTLMDSWVMGKEKTAGIVGNNTGTLKKLINKASVTSTKGPVGGVVGSSNDSYGNTNLVDSVYNFGVIKGGSDVGGILGYVDRIKLSNAQNHGLVEGEKYTGGIWGGANSTTIAANNLINYAKIIGQSYTGGIAGYCGHYGVGTKYSAKCGTFTNIRNEGPIQGLSCVGGIAGSFGGKAISINNSASIKGTSYVGGLFGNADFSTTTSLYNTGDVSGSKNVGGIIGYNQEGVTSSAYSTGKVDGDSLVGLMIGYNYNTTMADYYYLEQGDQEPFGLNNGGGVATPKSEKEMKSSDFAELLGEDFVYNSGLNSGFPILSWEQEK
ncbi:hypothetical protein [uncultured Fibrobacter sp.]|uniref:hypothetical protein n=1 Tax=uncultured Fibrobacter sp. TaxID=261512 RepID=UPI00262B3822|nr:hypothetical protein [uncultured Fibrobacter sp.]